MKATEARRISESPRNIEREFELYVKPIILKAAESKITFCTCTAISDKGLREYTQSLGYIVSKYKDENDSWWVIRW